MSSLLRQVRVFEGCRRDAVALEADKAAESGQDESALTGFTFGAGAGIAEA
jgi:hypothetical protein